MCLICYAGKVSVHHIFSELSKSLFGFGYILRWKTLRNDDNPSRKNDQDVRKRGDYEQ